MNTNTLSNHGGMPWIKNTNFNHILGFSRYVIDRQCNIFDLVENRTKTFYLGKNGYYYTSLVDDYGYKKLIGRHRILLLAFIAPPDLPSKLDVNHINGIRGDDTLDNLEWATRSDNCHHAYKTGLRSDNKKLIIRDTIGNIKEYYSLSSAAKELGICQATITNRCKKPNMLYDGYYFSSPAISNDKETQLWTNYPIEILNYETNVKIQVKDSKELYEKFPIVKEQAKRRLFLDSLIPVDKYILRSVNSHKVFPIITEDYKIYWKYKKPGSQPIRVLKDGIVKIYCGFAEFANEIGLHRCTVSKYLNSRDVSIYDGYVIEKINPN